MWQTVVLAVLGSSGRVGWSTPQAFLMPVFMLVAAGVLVAIMPLAFRFGLPRFFTLFGVEAPRADHRHAST